ERFGVRDRHERRSAADGGKAPAGAAVQLQLRRTAAAHDLDVPPENTARVSGTERLHGRLLRGEAAGKVNGRLAAPRAVRDFALREDATDEAIAVSLDRCGDARNIGCVQAKAYDGGHAVASA